MYKDYIKDKPKGSPFYVTRKRYGDIIRRSNDLISGYVLNESYHFKFPYGLGILNVVKKRLDFAYNKLAVDWAATKKYGKKIFHTNEHTNEYKYSWMWNLRISSVTHSSCYLFVPARGINRELAKMLKNGKDYLE